MTVAAPPPDVDAAAAAVRRRLGGIAPRAAIVLGSGLGPLAGELERAVRVPQRAIAGFAAPRVAGHPGELVAGTFAGVPVIVQSGRVHCYEGYDPAVVALPVRVFARLGVEILIVTNAAGAIRATLTPGALMVIADHINLMWRHPLAGPVQQGEDRFPDMSEPYDPALRRAAHAAATARNIRLDDGVYAGVLGPSYETPAEIRMLERLGADAVGMSTVPEVIVARSAGLRCIGVSVIANFAAGRGAVLDHEEVLAAGRRSTTDLTAILTDVMRGV